jgi:hypothetical protein
MLRIDPAPRIPAGTRLSVRLSHAIGTHVGDAWRGVLEREVAWAGGGRLPAGSVVDGIVSAVHVASATEAGGVELRLISLAAEGRIVPLHAASTRLAGRTAAGAQTGTAAKPDASARPARTLTLERGSEVVFRVR